MSEYRMSWCEAEELLFHIAGLSDDEAEHADRDEIAEGLFDCEFHSFTLIASKLLPLAALFNGALSGKMYQGFAQDGVAIVKRELEHTNG